MVVPLALPMARLTYQTAEPKVVVGARVVVTIGAKKRVIAIVARVGVPKPEGNIEIKAIEELLDYTPLIGVTELKFIEWTAEYYMCKVGDILRSGLSPLFSSELGEQNSRLFKNRATKKKIERQRPQPLEWLRDNSKSITLLHTFSPIDIASAICSMHQEGKVTLLLAPTHQAATAIQAALEPHYSTALCTSSSSIKHRAKLTVDMAVGLHPEVIVGTRNSLWFNYQNLGAVVITNEESFHYRSASEPYISARECALVLASLHGVKSLLISNFPSVESYYNAHYGEWGYITTEEHTAPLNSIVLERGREDMVSIYTKEQMAATLESGRKVVLLQNRRGVASFVECESCGDIPQCPNCSTSLNLHTQLLGCHYCGYQEPIITQCKVCGSPKVLNRGRGTQQIEAQLQAYFPTARVLRLDSDSFADSGSRSRKVIRGEDVDWDIIIGTTMLLEADIWQEVGVTAVLNFDNMVSAANFRVEEEAYRTIGTLATMCRESESELIIQSGKLKHRSIVAALGGREEAESFYRDEIISRRPSNFPPHSRMVRLELRGKDFDGLLNFSTQIESALRGVFHERLSPLYQPPVERQRGEYILELLLKIERGRSFARAKEIVSQVLTKAEREASKRHIVIEVEVDPT